MRVIVPSRQSLEWGSLCQPLDLTADEILTMSIRSKQVDVEVLAEFLDQHYRPGLLEAWTRAYVETTEVLLGENLPLTNNVRQMFANPEAFFNSKDSDKLRQLIGEAFSRSVNGHSPRHVVRALIAQIELSLGEYRAAACEAGFAWCEKWLENFGDLLHANDRRAESALMRASKDKAQLLSKVILPR